MLIPLGSQWHNDMAHRYGQVSQGTRLLPERVGFESSEGTIAECIGPRRGLCHCYMINTLEVQSHNGFPPPVVLFFWNLCLTPATRQKKLFVLKFNFKSGWSGYSARFRASRLSLLAAEFA